MGHVMLWVFGFDGVVGFFLFFVQHMGVGTFWWLPWQPSTSPYMYEWSLPYISASVLDCCNITDNFSSRHLIALYVTRKIKVYKCSTFVGKYIPLSENL